MLNVIYTKIQTLHGAFSTEFIMYIKNKLFYMKIHFFYQNFQFLKKLI